MIRFIFLLCALFVAGCSGTTYQETATRAASPEQVTLPPMKSFSSPRPQAPGISNGNIARDFLDLHFALESGRVLPVFTRFETPITVRMTGHPTAQMGRDLDKLLARLRSEAGLQITRVPASANANITIQAVSQNDIRRALPQAACFVVPNVTSLAEYRREKRRAHTNWALLRDRQTLAIFLPSDSSPQEARDCLHEELAQAIGPLNDLYRLPDSVFNDDNVHTVLTGFDMLILRATYAPELRTGMTRQQVAAQLPTVLARLNPNGQGRTVARVSETPRAWIEAVETALGTGASDRARTEAATRALSIATQMKWTDHRRAFSHYMNGRILLGFNVVAAQEQFDIAHRYLSGDPRTRLHNAYVTTQTAAFALSQGNPDAALQQLDASLEAAAISENAALMSTLMMLKSEALYMTGRRQEALALRLDSLGWARYGFGTDWAVQAKMQEIASLRPRHNRGG